MGLELLASWNNDLIHDKKLENSMCSLTNTEHLCYLTCTLCVSTHMHTMCECYFLNAYHRPATLLGTWDKC